MEKRDEEGSRFKTDQTRFLAAREKMKNKVVEVVDNLSINEIELLISEQKKRISTSKVQAKRDKLAKSLDFDGLEAYIVEQKDARNIKLYNTYLSQWKRNENDAKSQLASTFKKPEKRKAFEKTRVSIHQHAEKVRTNYELN